jgi:uncharacterized protein YgfB (UPF0149 family)
LELLPQGALITSRGAFALEVSATELHGTSAVGLAGGFPDQAWWQSFVSSSLATEMSCEEVLIA